MKTGICTSTGKLIRFCKCGRHRRRARACSARASFRRGAGYEGLYRAPAPGECYHPDGKRGSDGLCNLCGSFVGPLVMLAACTAEPCEALPVAEGAE